MGHDGKELVQAGPWQRPGRAPELKREAAAVLKAAGLDVSTAIRMFLCSVVEKGGLPIDVPRPNLTTLAAIRAAKAGKLTDVSLEEL